jgi:hypothetical protein
MANSSRSRGRGSGTGSRHPARRPSQRSAAQPHPKSGNAAKQSQTQAHDPYGTGISGVVAKKTGFILYWLSQRPKWFLPLVLATLFLVGLFWIPYGAFALVALAIVLTWFTILSWPILGMAGRAARILFVVGLLVYGVVEMTYLASKK